jgi:fructokinase
VAVSANGGTIVVGGEALVDVVVGDSDALTGHAGGGPYNVARTIGRLERPVTFLGRISTDRLGQRLARELTDDGVRLDSVVPTEDSTTLALVETDGAGVATYRFYTEGTATPGLTVDDALAALPDDVAMLHVGTLGLVLEPIATALEAVVADAGRSTLVALDPNCRPDFIPDPDAYRARLTRVLARADLLKASDADLAWLEPGAGPVDAARSLLRDGPDIAVVTLGANGAVVVTADDAVPVPAVPANVVDTIGAGDAFGGALLAWWHERGLGRADLASLDRVVEATRFACVVAAKTCEQAGAVPPRRADLALY